MASCYRLFWTFKLLKLESSSYFQRKRSRLAESSPTQTNDHTQHFLPKMNTQSQKSGPFQPTFSSTYGATQLPKLGATSTYLPTLSTHNYVPKPAKPKPQVGFIPGPAAGGGAGNEATAPHPHNFGTLKCYPLFALKRGYFKTHVA